MKSNIPYINHLLETENPTILCLQEHWLFNFERDICHELLDGYDVLIHCIDDDDPIIPAFRTRGHGGVAIVYKRNLAHISEQSPEGGPRLAVLKVSLPTPLIVMSAYMPCRGAYTNEDFNEVVDVIAEILDKYDDHTIVLGGDININLEKPCSRSKNLIKLIQEKRMTYNKKQKSTFFHHDGRSQSQIDYILYSETLIEADFTILDQSAINSSTHVPVMSRLKVSTNIPSEQIKKPKEENNRYRSSAKYTNGQSVMKPSTATLLN